MYRSKAYTIEFIAHHTHIPYHILFEARVWHTHTSLHFSHTFIFIGQSAYTLLVIAHSVHMPLTIFVKREFGTYIRACTFGNRIMLIDQSAYTLLVIAHNAHIHVNKLSEARVWHTHMRACTLRFLFLDKCATANSFIAHNWNYKTVQNNI